MVVSILTIHTATIDLEIYAMGLLHQWDADVNQKLSFVDTLRAYAKRAPTNIPIILVKVFSFVIMAATFSLLGCLIHFFSLFFLPILLGHLLGKMAGAGLWDILIGQLANVFANCNISGPNDALGWNRVNTWTSFCLCSVEIITCCIFCKYHGHWRLDLEDGSFVPRVGIADKWLKENLPAISAITICVGLVSCLSWEVITPRALRRINREYIASFIRSISRVSEES